MGGFFSEQTEASLIKSALVAKYFKAWAQVVGCHAPTIAYIDLFAGKGRYEDGKASTPLKVLELACQDEKLSEKLVTIFNDANKDYANNLEAEINRLPGIGHLKHKPRVYCSQIDDSVAVQLESVRLMPSLIFIDPWGYKGLSLNLVGSVIKDWGCDCVFFFNYNRINMGMTNPVVERHMNALFGEERADEMRRELDDMSPAEREEFILNELAQGLNQKGARYVLPFRFRRPDGGRTTHHLIFLSKNIRGFEIMKSIMHQHSEKDDGIASFEHTVVQNRQLKFLFELAPRPIDELGEALIRRFSGRTISVEDIYKQHGEGTLYVPANHKEALDALKLREGLSAILPSTSGRNGMGR